MDVTPTDTERDSQTDSASALPDPRAAAGAWPTPRHRREAEEWALVLRAEGFLPEVRRIPGGFSLWVEPAQAARAASILRAWQAERAEVRQTTPTPLPPAAAQPLEIAAAYVAALTLLAFHLGLEWTGRRSAFVALGSSQADAVLAGQAERLVTALTLHSDLPHVLGNTFFGGFFLALLAARLGVGVGVLAFVTTGALGNLANAYYYGAAHDSIGASTGVFGLVGLLAGLAAVYRQRTAPRGRGAWVALGAGLGILAMIGTGGPRVDLSAHIFGLIAGSAAGALIALPLAARPPPRPLFQGLSAALAFALVLGAWRVAGAP